MVPLLTAPILITGASGQLGSELVKAARERGFPFAAVARPDFDFDREATIDACFASAKPSLVVNAAAYTAVDAAETNGQAADRSNNTGPARLAALCGRSGIPLIHISTDYVFDGSKGSPYLESDPTNPASVYGMTKRDGELAILASEAQAIILRTAWVYAAHGKNFVRTMLNAARKTNTLKVVNDQKGAPTAAVDLATVILHIAEQLRSGWKNEYRGIFHATSAGETTWHGFACAIFEAARPFGLASPAIAGIATADWPTPARRPADSRLDCTKLLQSFGCAMPNWQLSLPAVMRQLVLQDEASELSG